MLQFVMVDGVLFSTGCLFSSVLEVDGAVGMNGS